MSDLCMACEGSPKAPNDPCAVCGRASVPQDAREAVEAELRRRYVVRADDRQRDMGLSYVTAETRDLAKVTTDAAIAAVRACGWRAVPEGWRIVPIDPTPEMLAAFWRQKNAGTQAIGERGSKFDDYSAYHSMLSAAPEPPA